MAPQQQKGRRYYIKTYGCQMNRYDSERLASILEAHGYQDIRVSGKGYPDIRGSGIVLVNTCCVREHAENRAFGFISSLKNLKKKNPGLIVGICGCIPKEEHIDLKGKFPFVDLIFGPNEPERLREFLQPSPQSNLSTNDHLRPSPIGRGDGGEGFVTITHGCDNFCSYCVVPYVRGREVSRPMDEVLKEIRALVDQGIRDITLLGQNVNSYQYRLANLLREIGSPISRSPDNLVPRLPDIRISFLTSHPRDMSDEIIETVHALPYVAKEFHLPVQSGDDEILQKMNRGYTVDFYRGRVAKIRSLMPFARITTDVIAGFPGETEEQFQNTLTLIEEIRFKAVNMAAYSIRVQTAAAKMEGQLPDEIKHERLQRLIKVVREVV